MVKTNVNKDSSLRINRETLDRIKFLSHVTGIPAKSLVGELIENLFSVALNFKQVNFSYETSQVNATVTVEMTGRLRMIQGAFALPETDTKAQADKKLKNALIQKIKAKKVQNA